MIWLARLELYCSTSFMDTVRVLRSGLIRSRAGLRYLRASLASARPPAAAAAAAAREGSCHSSRKSWKSFCTLAPTSSGTRSAAPALAPTSPPRVTSMALVLYPLVLVELLARLQVLLTRQRKHTMMVPHSSTPATFCTLKSDHPFLGKYGDFQFESIKNLSKYVSCLYFFPVFFLTHSCNIVSSVADTHKVI